MHHTQEIHFYVEMTQNKRFWGHFTNQNIPVQAKPTLNEIFNLKFSNRKGRKKAAKALLLGVLSEEQQSSSSLDENGWLADNGELLLPELPWEPCLVHTLHISTSDAAV